MMDKEQLDAVILYFCDSAGVPVPTEKEELEKVLLRMQRVGLLTKSDVEFALLEDED
jgi:hypothetical protein